MYALSTYIKYFHNLLHNTYTHSSTSFSSLAITRAQTMEFVETYLHKCRLTHEHHFLRSFAVHFVVHSIHFVEVSRPGHARYYAAIMVVFQQSILYQSFPRVIKHTNTLAIKMMHALVLHALASVHHHIFLECEGVIGTSSKFLIIVFPFFSTFAQLREQPFFWSIRDGGDFFSFRGKNFPCWVCNQLRNWNGAQRKQTNCFRPPFVHGFWFPASIHVVLSPQFHICGVITMHYNSN